MIWITKFIICNKNTDNTNYEFHVNYLIKLFNQIRFNMYKTQIIIFLLFIYSCSTESPNSPSIQYYPDDQAFIDDLYSLNGIIDHEYILDRIESIVVDSINIDYYRIEKLFLNDMGLDSIPPSIGNLESLKILEFNSNNLNFLSESICNIYEQLDEPIDLAGNYICTPNIPDCLTKNISMTTFYDNQQCEILPDEEDLDFIEELIKENWFDLNDSTRMILKNELNNLTTWETFTENNKITSRITEIRYDDRGIVTIPIALEDLDSLERIELQNNQIKIIPNIIGNLTRLKYITIQKNEIEYIPARIGELKKLEVMKIYENKLVEIHENIGNLSKLVSLNINNNKLTSLPEGMCELLNQDIQISIDNNKICNDYPICFEKLVNNSDGQDCP